MPDDLTTQNRSPHPWKRLEPVIGWIRTHERLLLLAGVGLQLIVLAGMIGMRMAPLITGETVLLRVVPVDPRSLFRGDYVILRYEFSQIPPEGIDGEMTGRNRWREIQENRGRTVYVSLVPAEDGNYWKADEYSFEEPEESKFIRGRVAGPGRLEFGIESFFVEEGKGKRIEKAIRQGEARAEVALGPNGKAVLRDLRLQ